MQSSSFNDCQLEDFLKIYRIHVRLMISNTTKSLAKRDVMSVVKVAE